MNLLRRFFVFLRGLPRMYQIGGSIVLVAILAVGFHALTRGSSEVAVQNNTSHVHLSSVADLSSQTSGPLPVVGMVTSVNHATILSQSSGEVISLNHQLGDYVAAGGVIAEMENSSQRATVQQAQGSYDAAQATYRNAAGATAQNSTITASQAAQSAANASAAVNTSLQSLYVALDDAVHTRADQLFTEPRTNPRLLLSTSNNQLEITLQNERLGLDKAINDVRALSTKTPRADVDADIAVATTRAQLISALLNDLVDALNNAIPTNEVSSSQISLYQTSIGVARTEVNSALSGLSSAKTTYDAAASSASSAQNSAGTGTSNTISAAQAQVEQALGTLNAAKAALEKTIVRSPISGTIVSLLMTQGGYVTASSQVADVSNPGALEIITNVTAEDAKTLAVGGVASIEGGIQGVIVSIAPALDPTTGKVQVKIGIPGAPGVLTDGVAVSVSLARTTVAKKPQTAGTPNPTQVRIPIAAAKITPTGPVAFGVTASSTLYAIPITLGIILGDTVNVSTGLTQDSQIVTDARGLSDGQQVVIDP